MKHIELSLFIFIFFKTYYAIQSKKGNHCEKAAMFTSNLYPHLHCTHFTSLSLAIFTYFPQLLLYKERCRERERGYMYTSTQLSNQSHIIYTLISLTFICILGYVMRMHVPTSLCRYIYIYNTKSLNERTVFISTCMYAIKRRRGYTAIDAVTAESSAKLISASSHRVQEGMV